MIFEIQRKFGSWFLLSGSLLIFFSSSSLSGPGGIIYFAAGLLVFLFDPAIYFYDVLRQKKSIYTKQNAVYATMLASILIFFARFLIHVPSSGGGTAFMLKNILLVFFIALYVFSILYRFALFLLGETGKDTGGSANRGKFMMETLYSVVIALLLFVLFNYMGSVKNPSLDLSPGYYSFGDASRTIIRSLDRNVKITAFLPVQQASASRNRNTNTPELYRISDDIKVFLEQLPVINSRIELELINADLESPRLNDFPATGNGTIVFRVDNITGRGDISQKPYVERIIRITSEKEMETIEKETVRSLIQVSSPQKKLYYTSMNGEKEIESSGGKILAIDGMNIFKNLLTYYNFQFAPLNQNLNWPLSVPADCDVLMILGPSVPFSDPAKTAVMEYLKKGGHVFIAIDPAGQENFSWLISENLHLPYKFISSSLTNVKAFPGTPITDFFGKHRITENLSVAGRGSVVFPASGYFEKLKSAVDDAPPPPPVVPQGEKKEGQAAVPEDSENHKDTYLAADLVMTQSATFIDKNKNGNKDTGENTGNYVLAIAAENNKRPLLVLFSGVNWISNAGLGFPVENKNAILAANSLFWMTESNLAAAIPPETRNSRSVQITDDLKFRNMMLGMVLFPLLTIVFSLSGVYYYRNRRSAQVS